MRKLLGMILIYFTPLFGGSADPGSTAVLQPAWIQILMLFAMLLVGVTSRRISRIR